MFKLLELREDIEQKRSQLNNSVEENWRKLVTPETYSLSVELDELIVNAMKREMNLRKNVV